MIKKIILIVLTVFTIACSNITKDTSAKERVFAKIDCFEYVNYSFLKKIALIPLNETTTSKEQINQLIQLRNEIETQIKVYNYEKKLYTENQLKENLNLISDIINIEIIDILLTNYSKTFDRNVLALAFNGNACISDNEIRELNTKYILCVMEIVENTKSKKQISNNFNNEYYDIYNMLIKLLLNKIREYYLK